MNNERPMSGWNEAEMSERGLASPSPLNGERAGVRGVNNEACSNFPEHSPAFPNEH